MSAERVETDTGTAARALVVHLFGLLAIFIALAIALAGMRAPSALGNDAPIETFSAERAMRQLRDVAAAPHPVGSQGHDAVRDLLLARLGELGLEPTVQKTETTQKFFGRTSGAILENVVARIRGRGGDRRAILFTAHYDSVPQSFGAGDDGLGVAALLEGARALVQGPPLDRDVLLVFTDGEELGLLGASAFVAEHPAAKDVIVDFNFDARGTSGGVAMFDTSDQNGGLLATLAAVPHVQASSFVSAVAKLLPNDTDATIFKKAGIPTMSFAVADEVENYHRATDVPERIDARSLQAMGDIVVALARHLGRGPLPALDGDDVAYVTLGGRSVVRLPFTTVRLAGVAALAIALAAAFVATRRRFATWGGVAFGAGAVVAALLLSGTAAALLHALAGGWASVDARMVRSGSLAWAGIASTVVVTALALRGATKRVGALAVQLGAYCTLSLVAAVFTLAAPAASIPLLACSAAAALPALALALLGDRLRGIGHVLVYLGASFAALVVVPTLYSVTIAAAATALVPVAILALPLALFVAPFATTARRRALAIFAGAGAVVIAIAFLRLAFPLGDTIPPRSTLEYGVDADRKQGFFFGSEPHPWMAAALSPESAQRRPLPELTLQDTQWFVGPPEVTGLEGAVLQKSERRRIAEGFEVRATIQPSPEARCVSIWDESKRIEDVASVDGKPVRHLVRFSPEKDEALMAKLRMGGFRPAFTFSFCGMHGQPIEVVFQTREEAPVPVRLVQFTDGMPAGAGGAAPVRPKGEIPTDDSDRTVVVRSVRL